MKIGSPMLAAFAAGLLLALPGNAATASFEDTAVDSSVLLSNTQGTQPVTINWRYTSPTQNRWAGFSFSAPSDSLLGAVSFQLIEVQEGALNASGTIFIISLPDLQSAPAAVTDIPDFFSTLLHSESFTLPESHGGQTYLSFALEKPFPLKEGGIYGIVLSFDSNASKRQIDFSAAGSASRNLGRSFYTNAGQSDGAAAFTTSNRQMNVILKVSMIPNS